MTAAAPLTFATCFGAEIAPCIPELAALRISGFRAFPYLYAGSLDYERRYLEGYVKEPRAMLIRAFDRGRVVAAATAVPLCCSSDIVETGPELFAARGFDPATFYYYAEILVEPAYRGRGVAQTVYRERERWARELGYKSLCLAVVERPADHPLRPADYVSPERIWKRDGFVATDITFSYEWPTIQADGSVQVQENPMRYWMKTLG